MNRLTLALLTLVFLSSQAWSQEGDKKADPKKPDPKKVEAKIKEIAGSAEFLRSVPKHFATLKAVDAVKRTATLLFESDKEPKVWALEPDAEVKVMGWWGRLEDLPLENRVWVWLKTDRKKQPVAVSMIADEMSQQEINGGVKFESFADGKLTYLNPDGKPRTLDCSVEIKLKKGDKVYVQSEGMRVRTLLDQDGWERRQRDQKEKMRERWKKEGLPGAVAFVHVFSGEMDLMLDHETMRWARSLEKGDGVTLAATPPIKGVVKNVEAWRERTQVRLVVRSFDLADLRPGERIHMLRTPPADDVDTAHLPPDLDKSRSKVQRVDWFLANIYCTCKVGGNGCTGMFYTLASCNPNACAMPLFMRKVIGDKVEEGKTDRQIFEELLKTHGPTLLRPHLLP